MADEVRIGMLGSGFIGEFHYASGLRYVPGARVVANCGAGGERGEAFAARHGIARPLRLDRRPSAPTRRSTSSSSSLPEPPPPRGGPGRGARTARASPARSRSAGTRPRPPRCSASSSDAGVFHGYLENVVFSAGGHADARDGRRRARIGRLLTIRAREGHSGPHAAALLGCRDWPAAARSSTWPRTASRRPATSFGKDVAVTRRLRLGRDARPRRQDDRRGQRDHAHPLRGRPGRDDATSSWSSKGGIEVRFEVYGDARPDRPGHRLDADPGVHRASRSATSARRPTPTPAGSIPVADEPHVHGHDAMMRRLRRGVPRRRDAARDVRGRPRRQHDHRCRLPLDAERPLGAGRRPPVRGGCRR